MKYKLTDITKKHGEVTLHRIVALKSFGSVKAGDLGGWLESELNLSHDGDCWVHVDAWVYGNMQVSGNMQVMQVSGGKQLYSRQAIDINTAPINVHNPKFYFSNLPNEVEEVVIAGFRYKKETTWKKI